MNIRWSNGQLLDGIGPKNYKECQCGILCKIWKEYEKMTYNLKKNIEQWLRNKNNFKIKDPHLHPYTIVDNFTVGNYCP